MAEGCDWRPVFDPVSYDLIGCAIEAHRRLGPGLLESAYEQCLARELALRGFDFQLQVAMPVRYKGLGLDCGYRVDFLFDGKRIAELKSVERVTDVHRAQLLTYMKLAEIGVGLLINFNVRILRDGIERFVL